MENPVEPGFTVQNWKLRLARHPIEDSYSFDRGISAVADGVTRDPTLWLPDTSKLIGKLEFALSYPRASLATAAANTFTNIFPGFIVENYLPSQRDEKAIRKAFEFTNNQINELQAPREEIDYLTNDLAGCVAAVIVNRGETISWGYITDSGIAVFDPKGNMKFKTEAHEPPALEDVGLENWRDPNTRRTIRCQHRNNPLQSNSFGVLTGEPEAMHYLKTGTYEPALGEKIFAYTDGLEPTIQSGEFADLIRNNESIKRMRELCRKNVKTEGTLVMHPNPKKR